MKKNHYFEEVRIELILNKKNNINIIYYWYIQNSTNLNFSIFSKTNSYFLK